MINGTWDSKLEGSPVIAETVVKGKSSLEIGPTKTLWRVRRSPRQLIRGPSIYRTSEKLSDLPNILHLNWIPMSNCKKFILSV